jgi:hypothetical protein
MEETVRLTARRQERVRSGELTVHAVIDEAALRRPVGDPPVVRDQLDRLLEDAARPNVTLQIVPFSRGLHPGLDGSFQQLAFPTARLRELVYVEGMLGNFLLDKPGEVGRYRRVFGALCDRFALPADHTGDWLRDLRAELAGRPVALRSYSSGPGSSFW